MLSQSFNTAHCWKLQNGPRPTKVSLSHTAFSIPANDLSHLSVKHDHIGLIQVFSPKQLARPSNKVHTPVVRPPDATAVQQSVILAHGPNYQPCHSDLSKAVSNPGRLHLLGKPSQKNTTLATSQLSLCNFVHTSRSKAVHLKGSHLL